jgi:hypothetical protein
LAPGFVCGRGESGNAVEVTNGSSYASQNELILTFGLAQAARVDEIQIRWPSGAVQSLHNMTADQTLIVREKLEPANLWN